MDLMVSKFEKQSSGRFCNKNSIYSYIWSINFSIIEPNSCNYCILRNYSSYYSRNDKTYKYMLNETEIGIHTVPDRNGWIHIIKNKVHDTTIFSQKSKLHITLRLKVRVFVGARHSVRIYTIYIIDIFFLSTRTWTYSPWNSR